MPYQSTDLWDEKVTRKKYIISAGISKTERPLYLSEYTDCDEWRITIIPRSMSKRAALKLIKRVEAELPEIRRKFPRKYPADMKFELVEFNDPYEGDTE